MKHGIDIMKIDRVEELKNHPNYLDRLFTREEKKYIIERKEKAETIAGIISVKESFFKALGIGIIGPKGLKKIEVLHDEQGRPFINKEHMGRNNLIEHHRIKSIDISISHDCAYVISSSIIEFKKEGLIDFSQEEIELASHLPTISENFHKYDMGAVLLVGGSLGMTGSIIMSGKSAMRAGAGIVYILVDEDIFNLVQIKTNEEVVLNTKDISLNKLLPKIDSVIIGPGMKKEMKSVKLIQKIIEKFNGPIIIDADGLNIISEDLSLIRKRENIYLTPHLMEFSRLSHVNFEELKDNPDFYALEFVKENRVNLLLKGNTSLILPSYINRQEDIYMNRRPNPGMATAGSGDVLSGIMGGLLAKKDNFHIFKLSVLVHSVAGEISRQDKGDYGMIAGDIIENIPYSIETLRELL